MKRAAKKSLRETLIDNRKAETFFAGMFGKPLRDDFPEIKDKQVRVKSEVPTESQEQRAFVKWFRLQYPAIKFFAIPNGGNRDAITGAIMKAEGVSTGVPDLYFPKLRLWIEFKRIKGSVISADQREWETYLRDECHDSHFYAYGCDDAIAQVRLFMKYRDANGEQK